LRVSIDTQPRTPLVHMSLFFLVLGIWVNDDYKLIFSSMWCPVMVKIIKSLDLMQHRVAIEGYVKFVAYLLYIKSGGRYATVFGVRIYSRFGQQQHVQGASTKVGNLTDLFCLPWKNLNPNK